MKKHRVRSAFTLIEVLVALAILSASALVLAMAYSNVIRDYAAVFNRKDHAGDLQMIRGAVEATADLTTAQDWNDIVLPDNRKGRWRVSVTPGQIADLFAVDCQIEITGGPGEDNFNVTDHMMLLRPTWSQPADRETLRAASRDKLAQRQWN
ncbi:MAG TPA: type II secretion system protein [Candidatus Didemnitutus sp.]|nr:type II secretion system protein [Candidatus Didemnitutus sp.]